MSIEIQDQFSNLREIQRKLLSDVSKLQSLDQDDVKISIFDHLNNFDKALRFIAQLLEFEFEIDLTEKITTLDDTLLNFLTQYDESSEFFTQFKRNFIQKQFDLKRQHVHNFEKKKLEKFAKKETDDTTHEIKDVDDQPPLSSEAKVMQTTKKITSKLAQSSQILQSSLVQSQLNLEELTIQNDALSGLADKYGYLRGVLEKSDNFINDIKLSSEKDKKRMYYALGFFGLCILKIWWSRLLKLPFMIFFKFFLYTIKLLLATFGLISKRKSEVDFVTSGFTSTLEDTVNSATSTIEIEIATETDTYNIASTTYDEAKTDDFEEELGRIIDEL